MSLTSFLKSDGKALFNTLPNLTEHMILCRGTLEPVQPNGLVVPREDGADPALIGTAYDFFCRAFVQRMNGQLLEKEMTEQIIYGLANIKRVLPGKDFWKLESLIQGIWKTRVAYIQGEDIAPMQLAMGAIKLAYVEQAFRSGRITPDYDEKIPDEDVRDLCNLINAAYQSPRLLLTKEKMYMNPRFGYYSFLVGGADADMVFGTTLIDIKTTVHMNGFKEYFQQLFGYYLLSEFDETFDASLQNLAVYLPRFDALYYVKLDVIRNLIDIDAFAKQFLKLIEEYRV